MASPSSSLLSSVNIGTPLRAASKGVSRFRCLALPAHTTQGLSDRRYYSSRSKNKPRKERVVILGSGWAGYAFARTLDPTKFERIVVSPRSYFVFTPLLASTAVGTVEFRAILEPVRRLPGVSFCQGWADDVDFTSKTVRVESNAADVPASTSKTVVPADLGSDGSQSEALTPPKGKKLFDISYDKLVIACGAYSQTFGIEGVREHANFLRDIGDARKIRLRVLSLFEQCSYPSNPTIGATSLTDDEKRALLHFAIVGGGPTGIEFAAELNDLIYEDLARIYPDLIKFVQITVYDVAPKVLPMFDQALAKYAMDTFTRQGINVKTQHHLERIRLADGPLGKDHGVLRIKIKECGEDEISAGLVVWSTGLMSNPLIQKLAGSSFSLGETSEVAHLAKDPKTGGLLTDPYLRAHATITTPSDNTPTATTTPKQSPLNDVFVIGDCAVLENDRALPKTAQVASQQAVHLAKALNNSYGTGVDAKPFKFRNWGTMTYLGGWKAIHQSSADELKGWVAWVFWRGAYVTKSMSVRNKILVPVYWLISWAFGRGISRF
ncbi:pyridine nucleotide-disulfide oxidoreductase-domain-containing protein [Bombardia bombarda]|uniref:Pyridine nucleotide-disulfide oxidoreductase-domain-containing protein n=1 Tax=Bombardia bombarda TaxID=252184 RepID=A0AA39XBC5_9PEZI|nr:pyridine nucleotide-disulfide oxidoreductase-domain-containing protein [Bombardia bombarda]